MAYENTWNFSTINFGYSVDSYTQRKMALNGVKTALLSTGLWTIYGCCGKANGSTLIAPSSLPDTTDRWSVTSDVVNGNGLNTAHGWVILYNSTLNIYLILSHAFSSCFHIVLSQTPPTLNATNSQYIPTIINSIEFSFNDIFSNVSSAFGRVTIHLAYTTQGHFIFYSTIDINSSFNSMMCLLPVSSSRSGDTTPFVFTVCNYYAYDNANEDLYVSTSDSYSASKCFVPLLTPNTPTNTIFCELRGYDNVRLNNTTDAADNCINLYPIFAYGYTTGVKCLKGRIQDVYWAPKGLSNGDTTPASGGIEYMCLGPLCIPANSNLVY